MAAVFKKISFFLLGAFSAIIAYWLRWLFRPPVLRNDQELELLEEAVLRYDAAGHLIYANPAAQSLGALNDFCYPSGQTVPSGEVFFRRVPRTRKAISGAEYLMTDRAGEARRICLSASLTPDQQNVIAVLRDITVQHEIENRIEQSARQQRTLAEYSRRLAASEDEKRINAAIVEGALGLVSDLPQARVCLFSFTSATEPLTLVASAPDERPKRPRLLREAVPVTIPFDATSPWIWQLYIARQSVAGSSEIHLPLLSGGAAIGHLSVSTGEANAPSLELAEALGLWANLAALARSRVLAEEAQARQGRELAALYTVGQAATVSRDWEMLADVVTAQVKTALGCPICTLAVFERGEEKLLRVRGESYRDALLFPESDPEALCDALVYEAANGGQTVIRNGIKNPALGGSPWSAFAGQSGRHSVLSAPLKAGDQTRGALTVYSSQALTQEQRAFVETLAALLVNNR